MPLKKTFFYIVLDLSLLVLAACFSWSFHWELTSIHFSRDLLLYIFIATGGLLLSFYCFGVYRFIWHYAGLNEFLTIIMAATCGTIIVFIFSGLLIPQIPKFLNLAL